MRAFQLQPVLGLHARMQELGSEAAQASASSKPGGAMVLVHTEMSEPFRFLLKFAKDIYLS